MNRSKNSYAGFTLIELLVVISIIALLVGILLPALAAARSSAQKAVCLSNIRQTGVGMLTYSTDNQDFYPLYIYSDNWNQSPYTYSRSGINAPANSNGDPAYWWTSKLVEAGYLPGPLAFDCPTLESIPLPTGSRDFTQMTAGQTPGDTALAGWSYAEYGYNAYFLGSGMGLTWKNEPSTRRNLNLGSLNGVKDRHIFTSSARTDNVDKPSDTIGLADSRNYATESALLSARGVLVTFGISYLYPKTEADNTRDQYGFADPRHKSSVNLYWTDGHGDSFSVSDPDQPYGRDELTDAVAYPNDNKWDLQ